jgi:hypothetical protein
VVVSTPGVTMIVVPPSSANVVVTTEILPGVDLVRKGNEGQAAGTADARSDRPRCPPELPDAWGRSECREEHEK